MKSTPYTATARKRVKFQLSALNPSASDSYRLALWKQSTGTIKVATREGSIGYTSDAFPDICRAIVHIATRGTNTGNDAAHFSEVARRWYRRNMKRISSLAR
jgi:hypothetical protein